MSDSSDRSPDGLDPDEFIARAQRRWRRTADEARARYELARTAGPAEVARAGTALARILKGPGYSGQAGVVLDEALAVCRQAAIAGDQDAFEPLADVLTEAGRRHEAIRIYEAAAAAGKADAVQRAVELILDSELVDAVEPLRERAGGPSGLSSALRRLPERERQVLAIAGLRPDPNREYVGTVLRLSPAEILEHERRGLELLDPILFRTGEPSVSELLHHARRRPGTTPVDDSARGLPISDTAIGGYVDLGGFDAEFGDPSHLPGQIIGGTLTDDERAMISLMDPKDRARYLLQKRIQEKTEMAVLVSQLQSLRHQTAMSVINNIR